MFNQDFLKTLTILYVEDEQLAREKLSQVLQRFFKRVIVASNGEEGYHTFQQEMLNGNIDLILSDINMPKMSGIEMLEKIRESNKDIPVIFTTARTESEYLLKAIELNTNHYVLKPIDIEDTINKVEEVCYKRYYEHLIKQKNLELEQYSSILDNVAAVFKLNKNKEISFINPQLLETLIVKESDILGQSIDNYFHKDLSNSILDEIWEKVKKGVTWQGNIKFLNLKNEIFYLNTTMFQIISDNGFEYVGIGFLSTQEVEEKRDFHKKVIENVKNNNLKKYEVEKKLEDNKVLIEKMKSVILEFENQVKVKNEKISIQKGQLENFEKEILGSNDKLEKILTIKNKEVLDLKALIDNLKKEKTIKLNQIDSLREEIDSAHNDIDKKEDIIKRQIDRIEGLKDLISHRESQLRKINPDLVL